VRWITFKEKIDSNRNRNQTNTGKVEQYCNVQCSIVSVSPEKGSGTDGYSEGHLPKLDP